MSKRILIADDDDDVLAGLAHLLQDMGHEVAFAGNGAHAVEVAAQFEPEVVILDLGMPFVDGLDVARELRRLPNGPAMMRRAHWLGSAAASGNGARRRFRRLSRQADLGGSAAFHPVDDTALSFAERASACRNSGCCNAPKPLVFIFVSSMSPLIWIQPASIGGLFFVCAEHAQQLGDASPLSSLMVVKD